MTLALQDFLIGGAVFCAVVAVLLTWCEWAANETATVYVAVVL